MDIVLSVSRNTFSEFRTKRFRKLTIAVCATVFFAGINLYTAAQTYSSKIDSLENVLQTTPEDTNRVNTLIKLCEVLTYSDTKRVQEVANETVELSQKIDFKKGEGKGYVYLGYYYHRLGNEPRAIEFLLKALTIFETISDNLAHWWGPVGFKVVVKKLEFRPGGIFHYCMQSPDRKNDMWGRFTYDEIIAPEKISFINSFSDEEGNITSPPFDEPWPAEIYNEVTLIAQGNKTLLKLRAYPLRATEAEHAIFLQGFSSMEQGYGGTFDALEAYLSKTNV